MWNVILKSRDSVAASITERAEKYFSPSTSTKVISEPTVKIVEGYKRPKELLDAFDLYDHDARTHYQLGYAKKKFAIDFSLYLSRYFDATEKDLVILCVGTDRSTGDSLGPLVGSRLKEMNLSGVHVYGDLENPVHAVNLIDVIDTINNKHPHAFVVAVDSCLGRTESVGYISLKLGPLKPGTGVQKELPAVGDLSLIGIVNVGGFMEYMVLQNTRLHLVLTMSDIIAHGIKFAASQIFVQESV
jgi:putative sporulation protein YyaC